MHSVLAAHAARSISQLDGTQPLMMSTQPAVPTAWQAPSLHDATIGGGEDGAPVVRTAMLGADVGVTELGATVGGAAEGSAVGVAEVGDAVGTKVSGTLVEIAPGDGDAVGAATAQRSPK